MKPLHFLPPAAALIASGIWLGLQQQSISTLEKETVLLREHVEAARHAATTDDSSLAAARTNGKKATHVCHCGYYGDAQKECRCSPDRVRQYQQRISGPLLDRIDLQVSVPRLSETEKQGLLQRGYETGPDSSSIRTKVTACRERQLERAGCCNARLEHPQIKMHCALTPSDTKLLQEANAKLQLSARATFRILKIARTIADLEQVEHIRSQHLLEAINYRRFDTHMS